MNTNEQKLQYVDAALVKEFGEEDAGKIIDAITEIYDGGYSIILPIVKKGYGTFITTCKPSGESYTYANVRSDKFLRSYEFEAFLKDFSAINADKVLRICAFDDAIRYQRKFITVYNEIKKACDANNVKFEIDLCVIAALDNGDSSSIEKILKDANYIKSFKCILSDSMSSDEIRKNAEHVLNTLFRKQYPCAVGAPRSKPINLKSEEFAQFCAKKDLLLRDDADLQLLKDLDIKLHERYITEDNLIGYFGKALGSYISDANIELYLFNEADSGRCASQIVTRSLIKPTSQAFLDKVLGELMTRFFGSRKDKFSYITNSSFELKFEWLSYILSSLVYTTVIGTAYPIDQDNVKEHYGDIAAEFIAAIEQQLMNDYENTRGIFTCIFDSVELLGLNPTEDESKSDSNPYVEYLTEIFSGVKEEYIRLEKYYDFYSKTEISINTLAVKHKLAPLPKIEIPIKSLTAFFGQHYDDQTLARREIIHKQITGSLSVVICPSAQSKSCVCVEKCLAPGEVVNTKKAYEAGEDASTHIAAYKGEINKSGRGYLEECVIPLHECLANIFQNMVYLIPGVHTIKLSEVLNGEQIVLDALPKLKHVWKYIQDEHALAALNDLDCEVRNILERVFVQEEVVAIEYDPNDDNRNEYTDLEDFAIKCGKKHTLYFRVKSLVREVDTKTGKCKVKLISVNRKDDFSKSLARIYKGRHSKKLHDRFKAEIIVSIHLQ